MCPDSSPGSEQRFDLGGGRSLRIRSPLERPLDGFLQRVGSAVDRLVQGRPFMADSDWLEPCQARLHETAFVTFAILLAAILICQVDFDARDAVAVAFQRPFDHFLDVPLQFYAAWGMVVSVNL